MQLYEFAFVPPTTKWLDQIAKAAIHENWGPDLSYLHTYVETNFEVAHSQNLLYEDAHKRFALFRVGHLVTNDGSPMYCYFVKNNMEGKQPYVLVTVLWGHSIAVRYRTGKNGNEERIPITRPPAEPSYDIPPYQPTFRIEYGWELYLADRQARVQSVLDDVILDDRARYLTIFGATMLAHRLHKLSAIPQYHHGRYQYLLPLFITHDNYAGRPDLVAALDEEPDRSAYIVRSLLPPELAYANARSVATNISQLRAWLNEEPARQVGA